MKDRSSPTRTQTHEIAIDASEEAVWKAIADGEELTRWFVDAAKVEPGVGRGRVRIHPRYGSSVRLFGRQEK